MALHAVVMAGGSGTRFWPASRARRPKQFLPLAGGKPLLRATLDRVRDLCAPAHTWIVTNSQQAEVLLQLLPGFPRDQVLIEPEARDTGPCVALATATIAAADPSATMIVLPADHVIEPIAEFHRMLRRGVEIAADGTTLVTFGIPPTFAATGYGYIECGEDLDGRQPRARRALRFREKPDAATAQQFVTSGAFWWNSGIFVWRVEAIRRAMASGNEKLAASCTRMLEATQQGRPAEVKNAFAAAPRISIDYAVMEKADRVAVVAAPIRWDDVGSFPALTSLAAADADGNRAVVSGGASSVTLQAADNLVYAEGPRTVALFGVENLVVVAVGDAVLVCPRERAHDLKQLVDHLRAIGRSDLL